MAKNNGKSSEDIFIEHWDTVGKSAYLERLVDTGFLKGMLLKKGLTQFGFLPANPSDFILTLNGIMEYAEVKSTQCMSSFSFKFRTSQWAAMKKQVAAKGRYTVYVHQIVLDTWYAIPAETILMQKLNGINSLKWELLEQYKWTPQSQKKRKDPKKPTLVQ